MAPETITLGTYLSISAITFSSGSGDQLIATVNVTLEEASALIPVWLGVNYVSESGSNDLDLLFKVTPPGSSEVQVGNTFSIFKGGKSDQMVFAVVSTTIPGTYVVKVYGNKPNATNVRCSFTLFTAAWKR